MDLQPVVWTPELGTGIDPIDREHRQLFGLFNDLIAAIGLPTEGQTLDRAISELFAYANSHFSHEEALMISHHYPGYAAHFGEHERFVRHLIQIRRGLATGDWSPVGLAGFVRTWIVEHIQRSDRRFADFIHERPRGPTAAVVSETEWQRDTAAQDGADRGSSAS